MKGNKNRLRDKAKSGKQLNEKVLLAFNQTETNIGNLDANKNEKDSLKRDHFQQKHLTTKIDRDNTNIVNIEDAEKVNTREENY